jgi:TP901 family phage tail tape measure protein
VSTVTEELLLRIAVAGGAVASAEVGAFNARIAETEATAGRARKGIGGFSNALFSLKGMFASLGVAAAVKDFASFQAQMERLRTQTGATQGEVTRMSKGILDMAVSVGTGPNSLAQAMYHIESAGYRGKMALDALHLAAEGAKVGGANLTDTTTGLTAVLVAGFKGVTTLKAAMGELNATVGAGDMTFQDLNDALSTGVLSTMKTLGLQVKDFGAAMAVLGDNNIRGAAAATRLRMSLMTLVRPSSTATAALKSLHLGQYTLAEDLRKPNGLMVMLKDLRGHLEGLTKTQRAADLAAIFGGGRNSAAMLTLIEQMGRLQQKYDQVHKGATGFQSAWQQTTKTMQFFIDQAKALGEVILIKLGKAVWDVIGGIKEFVKAFEQGKLWAQAIVAVAIAIGLVVTAIKAWELAQAALDAVMGLDPVMLAIMALIAVIVLLVMHWKQVKAVALDCWHWIQHAAQDVWKWLKQNWPLLLAILTGPFGLAVDFVVKHWNMIRDAANWLIHHALAPIFKALLPILEWPFKTLYSVLKGIWGLILKDVRWVVSHIASLIGTILGPIKAIGGFLGNLGGGIAHGLGSITQSLFGFADGGTVPASGAYMVGERGPEIVYLQGGSYVQPNHELGQPVGGGHPQVLEATLINVMDGKTVSKSVIRQGLMASARRGGGGPIPTTAG